MTRLLLERNFLLKNAFSNTYQFGYFEFPAQTPKVRDSNPVAGNSKRSKLYY